MVNEVTTGAAEVVMNVLVAVVDNGADEVDEPGEVEAEDEVNPDVVDGPAVVVVVEITDEVVVGGIVVLKMSNQSMLLRGRETDRGTHVVGGTVVVDTGGVVVELTSLVVVGGAAEVVVGMTDVVVVVVVVVAGSDGAETGVELNTLKSVKKHHESTT